MLPQNLRNEKNSFDRFDKEFQTNLIKALVTDKNFIDEISELIQPDYFLSTPHGTIVDIILNYYRKFYGPPSIVEIRAELTDIKNDDIVEQCKLILTEIENKEVNLQYTKEKSLEFCKNQKMRSAIEKSTDYLAKEEYEKIRKIITEATQFETKKDMGLNYDEDIRKILKTARKAIPIGYPILDYVFNGGFAAGELCVICGGPSTGKSFSLINFGKRIMEQGKSVLYITLELSEESVMQRFYSLISKIIINDLENQPDTVDKAVSEFKLRTGGRLKVKNYPTKRASVQTINTFIETIQARENFYPDIIIIDYADIVKPLHKGEAKKRFELENVYEDLRALAVERKVPILTASQANKEGKKSEYVSMENMSESYAKAAISDIVLGINRNPSGGQEDYGTCHISKNRGAGKDGYLLPVIYNTSLATIEIPADDYIEKIRRGVSPVNIAKDWFDWKGIDYRMENAAPTSGAIYAANETQKKYAHLKKEPPKASTFLTKAISEQNKDLEEKTF